jgi:hypothetical protein
LPLEGSGGAQEMKRATCVGCSRCMSGGSSACFLFATFLGLWTAWSA